MNLFQRAKSRHTGVESYLSDLVRQLIPKAPPIGLSVDFQRKFLSRNANLLEVYIRDMFMQGFNFNGETVMRKEIKMVETRLFEEIYKRYQEEDPKNVHTRLGFLTYSKREVKRRTLVNRIDKGKLRGDKTVKRSEFLRVVKKMRKELFESIYSDVQFKFRKIVVEKNKDYSYIHTRKAENGKDLLWMKAIQGNPMSPQSVYLSALLEDFSKKTESNKRGSRYANALEKEKFSKVVDYFLEDIGFTQYLDYCVHVFVLSELQSGSYGF